MKIGANFSSNGWSYTISDDKFKEFMDEYLGEVITFCPHAVSLDKPEGYQDQILDNVLRLVDIAHREYGVEAIVDLHTHMETKQLPYYFPLKAGSATTRRFAGVFEDPSVRAKWLDLVEHVADYIDGTPGLRVFHMMNEPFGYLEEFLVLWQEMKDRCPQDMKVSIRIAEPAIRGYNYDTRIHDIWDEVTINTYIAPWSPPNWTTQTQFKQAAQWARASGKPFIIGEFGSKTDDDALQTAGVQNHIDEFKSQGVDIAQCWVANPDASTATSGWNLFYYEGVNKGEPRPAFYLLEGGVETTKIRNDKEIPLTVSYAVTETLAPGEEKEFPCTNLVIK